MCWGMRGGREKQEQQPFQKKGTICSPSPLWGLVCPFLSARVPLTLNRLFASPPPSTSDHQTVPPLKAYGTCPPGPPPPASVPCVPQPGAATTLLPSTSSSAAAPSSAGLCLRRL